MATDADPSAADDYNAERIIAAFGGIRPMAKRLGVAVTTVQGWKDRGAIPLARMAEIRAAAEQAGIDLTSAPAPVIIVTPDSVATASAPPIPEPNRAEQVPPPKMQSEKIEPTPPHGVKPAPSAPKDKTIGPGKGRAWYLRPAFITGVLGLIVGAVAVYYLIGALRTPGTDPAVAAQLSKAEQRIAQLEAQSKSANPSTDQIAQIQQNVAQLAARLERLPPGDSAKLANDVRALGEQLAALDKRLTAAPPGDTGATAAALRDATAKIALLEKRVADLAARPASTTNVPDTAGVEQLRGENETLRAELKALNERLASVEKQKATPAVDPNLQSSAFIVAVGQLRDTVAAGKPYAAAFDSVRALAKNSPDLAPLVAQLEPHATKGVPSLDQLRTQFRPLPTKILRAERLPEDADWSERAWARVKSIVIVRRTGDNVQGATTEAMVARAESRMKAGDVAGAVAQIEAIKGQGAAPAQEWLAAAKAHVAANDAADKLSQAAVAALTKQAAPK